MQRTTVLAAILSLLGAATLLAQQPQTPTTITDQILVMDANNFQSYTDGPTAEEAIAKRSHFDTVNNTYVLAYHPVEHRTARTEKRDELVDLMELTVNCDAVIIGTPTLSRSALTTSHQFVFSDYEVRIDSILSDRRKMLGNANRLIVSRPGGQTTVAGNKVRAIETEYPLFHLGEQYIFFLIRTPSGSYTTFPSGTYLISGQSVHAARLHPKNETVPYPLARIEQEIRKAAEQNPRKQSEERTAAMMRGNVDAH